MKTVSIPLPLTSIEGAQALADLLRQQLESNSGLSDSLRATLGSTLEALDKGVKVLQVQEEIDAYRQRWQAQRNALATQAGALAKALGKPAAAGFQFQAFQDLFAPVKASWSKMQSHAARLVDEDSFSLEAHQKNPRAWKATVEDSLGHGERQLQIFERALQKWREEKPVADLPAVEPTQAKAIRDCATKAVALLKDVGSRDAALDFSLLEEASLYATYGQGFQTNDLTTVARLFRDSQRQQDSFLATFTPAMIDTAERFREEESLAWQQERVARSNPGPR